MGEEGVNSLQFSLFSRLELLSARFGMPNYRTCFVRALNFLRISRLDIDPFLKKGGFRRPSSAGGVVCAVGLPTVALRSNAIDF